MTLTELTDKIKATIKPNSKKAITGAVLQGIILDIVEYFDTASQDNVVFDELNNVVLRDGTKILGVTETGPETGEFIQRELIGMNKYNPGTPEQFYQAEVGNMHLQTTLNTADEVNVDTEHGREVIAYKSDLTPIQETQDELRNDILYLDEVTVQTSNELTQTNNMIGIVTVRIGAAEQQIKDHEDRIKSIENP